MLRITALLFLASFSCFLRGQNLIPNPEFDQYLACPDARGQIHNAPPWFSANGKTVDFAHLCAGLSEAGVPLNRWGEQYPLLGNGYAGIRTFFYSDDGVWENYREYLSVELLSPLEAGRNYLVRFNVSMGETARFTTDDIGLALTDTILPLDILPYTPAVRNPEGLMLSDKVNWRQIEGTFEAGGGERFATIGNFLHDSLTTVVDEGDEPDLFNSTYYYIDDVAVIPCAIPNGDSLIIAATDTFCQGENIKLQLNPKLSVAGFQWYDNSLSTSVFPTEPGWYWLEVIDNKGCHLRDSIFLHQKNPPPLDLGPDTLVCPGETWLLVVPFQEDATYLWQDGSTENYRTIEAAGTYRLKITTPYCSVEDQITVSNPPVPRSDFGFDSLICEGEVLELGYPFPDARYRWQDFSEESSFRASEAGVYRLQLETNCYAVSDEFVISTVDCDCAESIPNVFTPNGDGINDLWGIGFTPGVKNISWGIVDRWGRPLFQASNAEARWDGMYQGQVMPAGVYFWWANYRCWDGRQIVNIQNNGSLSLFR